MYKIIVTFLMMFLAVSGFTQEFNNAQKAQLPVNYFKNAGFESGVAGCSTFADAAATTPDDGTGGTANVTIATSTTSPLAGSRSLIFTKDAVNRQGQGFSCPFTIDSEDQGHVVGGRFSYKINSGTYADNDMSVWIYDVTNSALIQPAPTKIKNTGVNEYFQFEFQTSASSISYRLIFFVESTSASAYSLKIDSFNISRGAKVYSVGETDYSAKISSTGVISGENVDWLSSCSFGTQMTCNFTSGIFTVAPNCTFKVDQDNIAYSSQSSTSSTQVVMSTWNTSSVRTAYNLSLYCQKAGVDYANATAGKVSSSEADTRVVAAIYKISSDKTTTAQVNYDTKILDTHNAVTTGASWKFTAPVKGVYRVSANLRVTTGVADNFAVYKNGSAYVNIASLQTSATMYSGTSLVELNAGDYVDLRPSGGTSATFTGTGGTPLNQVSIEKLSGPSQITASETVSASYWVSANFAASSTTPINYDTKEWDSHNSVTTSPTAWKFTAPISGVYDVSVFTNWATATAAYIRIYKNGSYHKPGGYSVSGTQVAYPTQKVRLLAGEYIDIRPSTSITVAGQASLGGDAASHISIVRVGNY